MQELLSMLCYNCHVNTLEGSAYSWCGPCRLNQIRELLKLEPTPWLRRQAFRIVMETLPVGITEDELKALRMML